MSDAKDWDDAKKESKDTMYKDEDFKRVIEPVMNWLAENHNPHTKIIIDSVSAELVEGVQSHRSLEFIKD